MMGKERKKVMITLVLIVVFLLLWIRVLWKKKKQGQVASGAAVVSAAVEHGGVDELPDVIRDMIEEGEKAPLGKDPFYKIPLASGPVSIESLKVDGIAWDETTPTAIINGKLVFQGERLPGDIEVVEIRKKSVVLRQGEKEAVLPLLKQNND